MYNYYLHCSRKIRFDAYPKNDFLILVSLVMYACFTIWTVEETSPCAAQPACNPHLTKTCVLSNVIYTGRTNLHSTSLAVLIICILIAELVLLRLMMCAVFSHTKHEWAQASTPVEFKAQNLLTHVVSEA